MSNPMDKDWSKDCKYCAKNYDNSCTNDIKRKCLYSNGYYTEYVECDEGRRNLVDKEIAKRKHKQKANTIATIIANGLFAVLLVSVLFVSASMTVHWVKNPELSYMQITLWSIQNFWGIYLGIFVIWVWLFIQKIR